MKRIGNGRKPVAFPVYSDRRQSEGDWRSDEMTDLVQDLCIVVLAIVSIMQSFSLRKVREQLP